jgi:hypothetical protein
MPTPIDHRELYRLPWSFSDNAIAWLEPTEKCNLSCEGCYRANVDKHKSLSEIRSDLECFAKFRSFDGVSIAGGDPLMHPQIGAIVRMVKELGHKPILNTNGLALDLHTLRELKAAGLEGLTFHIDSKQGRPGWKNKTEVDLNELRLQYAEMAAEVGGLSCAFNSTVYEDTLRYVPDLVQFAHDHIDLVHVMVFIAYRAALIGGEFDYYVQGKKVDAQPLQYSAPATEQRADISSREIVATIQDRFPDFTPCSYLGGTEKPDSLKWLLTSRLGTKKKILGYAGPKLMALSQTLYHLVKGHYLAYAPPKVLAMGRSTLLLSPIDTGLRSAATNYLKYLSRDPRRLAERMYFQSITVIQPADVLPDGRVNMCDGCPDITVHDGELVWSCRLDERLKYGAWCQVVPWDCSVTKPEARKPAPASRPTTVAPA